MKSLMPMLLGTDTSRKTSRLEEGRAFHWQRVKMLAAPKFDGLILFGSKVAKLCLNEEKYFQKITKMLKN